MERNKEVSGTNKEGGGIRKSPKTTIINI